MGTAQAEGDDRAKRAVDEALHSPLLEDNDIRGAQHILLNIASGKREVTMDEIFEITEFIQQEAGFGTDLIWGNCYDETLGDKISVTVIATGFEGKQSGRHQADQTGRIVVSLDDDQPNKKGKQPFQSLFDIGFQGNEQPDSNTFEFKGVRTPVEKTPKETRPTHTEPYVREEEKERAADALRQERERERQRKEKLRANVVKLNNPQNIVELENEPAYMRRGVELEDMPDASHDKRSRWTIGDDEDTDFYSRSSFLHGNQD
jgi:cell division protein FtsZ